MNVFTFHSDISDDFAREASKASLVSFDIETSGLDWKSDKIGLCQMYIVGGPVALVRIDSQKPNRIIKIISDELLRKVFHFALFDLRFMVKKWGFYPRHIACTKIASKILKEDRIQRHSLDELLKHHLGVIVDKSARISDWFSESLTDKQTTYAANDVIYLPKLLEVLEEKLKSHDRLALAMDCYRHIPTRVSLDLGDYTDVYEY